KASTPTPHGYAGKCGWVEPDGEEPSIHARLLGHQPGADTLARFRECFSQAHRDGLDQPVRQARTAGQAGRFETAAAAYRLALERQPGNWVLFNEVALFLTCTLRDPQAGADLAQLALALNPISAALWNTLGDCLFEWGRVAEAGSAYRRAVQLAAGDVRARSNLAWVHERQGDYPAALERIA